MSLLSNPWVHTLKERQDSILFRLLTLSKQLEQSRNSLPPMPTGPTPKRKKSLSSYLPLMLLGLATRKGKSMQERFYSYFPLKNHKLGKGSSYSRLRIHEFFKNFLVMVFVVCEIRKS